MELSGRKQCWKLSRGDGYMFVYLVRTIFSSSLDGEESREIDLY